jgi:hypothetical protein
MTLLAPKTCIFFHFRGFGRMPRKAAFPRDLPMKKEVWLGAESNRRHADFQSAALPTELPSRKIDNRRRKPGVHYAIFDGASNLERESRLLRLLLIILQSAQNPLTLNR